MTPAKLPLSQGEVIEMKCKRIQEMMGAYLYGDLAPDEMREVRLHTQGCEACREDVESRGKVVSSIPSAAPELSDDERMQIAWGVKGAIRNGGQVREGFRWGYVAAIGSVVIAGLAVAALVAYNSPKRPAPSQMSGKPAPAVVQIKEEPAAAPKKSTTESSAQAKTPATSPDEQERPALQDRIADITRQFATPATAARHHPPKKGAAVEKPAPIVEHPQLNEPVPAREGEKLPKPTDPNDAQTAPQ